MIKLPAMPRRIARLPRDRRGYPAPWFVCWMDGGRLCPPGGGQPDFRVIAPGKFSAAYNQSLCWICGGSLIGHARVYVLGPMCVINRVSNEPPSHRECATFAAEACPFLTNPREKRSGKNLPEKMIVADGAIDRNPGAVALYQTGKAKPIRAGDGVLFELGAPVRVDWYAEGRRATRAEIEESIRTGFPLLVEQAAKQGNAALAELDRMRDEAMQLLPAA